jgi:hypothetical protein
MSELISLAWNILLNQVVCFLMGENSMHFLRAVSANIRPKHNTAKPPNHHIPNQQFPTTTTKCQCHNCKGNFRIDLYGVSPPNFFWSIPSLSNFMYPPPQSSFCSCLTANWKTRVLSLLLNSGNSAEIA